MRLPLHLPALDIYGRLDASIVRIDVADVFHGIGEDDAK
jgi:hypothetical protein